MKMRTTQPSNNPYYIRKVSGGYNGAVKGCPTIKGADVLCNCVGYANGRFAEIQDLAYIKYQLVCNAENFIEKAKSMGLEISAVPVLGGIMVWQRGATLSDRDGAGHVAVVEKVINAGQIITSESGWNAWAFKTVTRSNNNGRWGQSSAYKFRGCIVNPAIGRKGAEDIKSITVDGEWGVMTTLFSQQIMKTFQDGFVSGQRTSCKKYLPNALSSSWEFSKNGKGSELIKAIQRLVGAKVDGLAGQNTVKALQRFLKAQSYYTGKIDGIMGSQTVKGWQKWLNKPTYNPVPEEKPEEKTWVEKANAWAKKIANDNSYHYVKWTSKDKKTHECPICHDFPKGKYHGWNCIGFTYAVWHHGGGLPCKCNDGVISSNIATKMLQMTNAQALAEARKRIGLNDLKVIINKNGIPKSEWKAGDICMRYKGSTYNHNFYYMGDGKICDSHYNNGKVSNDNQIKVRSYKNYTAKIIIRYLGK